MSEKFRPQFHFAPRAGWMNDPNGLIRVDGVYHLFFQHDPDSALQGPMHWGHARSTDLVHWEELAVALYPTALGTCFSGSAIETAEGALKLFHTAHQSVDGRDFQTQCLVHADRALTSFTSEPANPVIDNPGLECFRDPKVIWHAATARWIMAVTLGQSIGFYSSTDLVDWRFESAFGEADGRHSDGPWECPDLLAMQAPDGSEHWVLLVGIGSGAYGAGSGSQYFIGQFDGHRFVNANTPETELWLDYGRDFYAAQSFFDRSGAVPVNIAWASNWLYARSTQTQAFRGVMSLPREMDLVEKPDGLRVAQQIPEGVKQAFGSTAGASGSYRQDIALNLGIGEQGAIALFGEREPHFVVHRTSDLTATVQTIRAEVAGMPDFAHDYLVELAYPANGPLTLELYVDRGLVELGTCDGLVWVTNLFFPEHPAGAIAVTTLQAFENA
ncbi:MAG: glycoside hydrolase family 32 protein [Alphaproteobacteria bacterium]|nr:glycoside hydrolase family 32 protein [Alphaproteobacteria bacterium]